MNTFVFINRRNCTYYYQHCILPLSLSLSFYTHYVSLSVFVYMCEMLVAILTIQHTALLPAIIAVIVNFLTLHSKYSNRFLVVFARPNKKRTNSARPYKCLLSSVYVCVCARARMLMSECQCIRCSIIYYFSVLLSKKISSIRFSVHTRTYKHTHTNTFVCSYVCSHKLYSLAITLRLRVS